MSTELSITQYTLERCQAENLMTVTIERQNKTHTSKVLSIE